MRALIRSARILLSSESIASFCLKVNTEQRLLDSFACGLYVFFVSDTRNQAVKPNTRSVVASDAGSRFNARNIGIKMLTRRLNIRLEGP